MKKINYKSLFLGIVLVLLLIFVLYLIWSNLSNENNIEDYGFFTIIVLPDTQMYTLTNESNKIFLNQTKWIIENRNEMNIKFVIHEGDLVNNHINLSQWDRANKSMSILDIDNVPYSVVPGNHDHPSTFYDKYFPASRFENKKWYGGNYVNYEKQENDNDNNFQLMSIGKENYIFLSLDWCPTKEEIQWANNTLSNYNNRKAILTTHGYLHSNAKRMVHVCGNTEYIWNDLIKYHENLQIVLCGHVHNESRRIDKNLFNKNVYQMLANYQDYENGGNGWLRILKFVPKEDLIYVSTYSPYLNKQMKGEKSEFILEYDMVS
jgi:3',5'-cyclic AMP phosphodiesterase CpdA